MTTNLKIYFSRNHFINNPTINLLNISIMIRFLLINNKKGNIMKILSKILVALIIVVSMSTVSFAHSGRTDSSGGHNCSAKSQQKGLCSGYHYHNRFKQFNEKNNF